MEFKIGTRVIVRPYDGFEYKGEIISGPISEIYSGGNVYYSVMSNFTGHYTVMGVIDHSDGSPRVNKVNVSKIRIDKEWGRDQKIRNIIND